MTLLIMFDELKPMTTLAEVRAFASYLFFDLETFFHPDDDFAEYVNGMNGDAAFTPVRVERLNQRMNECRGICDAADVDICEEMGVALEYFSAIASGVSPDQARKALKINSDAKNCVG